MPLSPPPPIESQRLVVRIVERSDLPGLLLVNGDDEVTHFLPYATWQSAADADAWFDRMAGIQATGTALQFVVVEKETGTPVGTCLLFRYDQGSSRVELGYVLGRAHWGRGYMREALRALLGHAFDGMGVRRVEAEVNPANVASVRILESIGFVKEGVARQRWVDAQKEPYDVALYGLLRHEHNEAPRRTR
jgi:[ribosomal protein S5]-alanine N-acetyltransferase